MSESSHKCGGECCQAFSLPLSPMEIKHLASVERLGKRPRKYSMPENEFVKLNDMLILIRNSGHHGTPAHMNRSRKKPPAFGKNKRWDIPKAYHIYTCKHYDKVKGLCGNYENRPGICRNYPNGHACYYKNCKADCSLKNETERMEQMKDKIGKIDKNIVEKNVTKELEFKLTTEEIATKGKAAAELAKEISDLENDFESLKKQWKGKIELKQGEKSDILRTIRKGIEARTVDCVEVKDFSRHIVSYVFNGEVMKERPMELNERQMELAVDNTENKFSNKVGDAMPKEEAQAKLSKKAGGEPNAKDYGIDDAADAMESAPKSEIMRKRDINEAMRGEKNAKTKKEIFN